MRDPVLESALGCLLVTAFLTAPGAGPGLGQDAQEHREARPEPVAVEESDGLPLPAPEELEPPDVPGTWEPIETFEGVPVRTIVVEPEGVLEQRYTVREDSDEVPVSHGPDWTYFPNGVPRVQQVWVDGVLSGPYRAWQESGLLRMKGRYEDGKREGVWLRYKAGQLLERFEYAAGQPHGAFHAWHRTGVPREETYWEHGVQVGRERHWNGGARRILDGNWLDGQRHGPWWEGFSADGTPKLRGTYDHGQRTGTWERWERAGPRILEEHYRADVLHGLQRKWRSDGSPESEIEFADGVQNGSVVGWYPGGQKQMEGTMVEGRREGRWSYWHPDGSPNPEWSGVYRDDQKVSD